jgi:toxin ParE1/3/4
MRVVLTPEARAELREAAAWYRKQSPLVSRRFVAEYKRVKKLIARGPERWAEVEPGVRRALFDKFPYALLYFIENERAVVVVVKHHSRHPDYWRSDR